MGKEKEYSLSQLDRLFVSDEEFSVAGRELAAHRDFLVGKMHEYIAIMDSLIAMNEGAVVDALRDKTNAFRNFPDRLYYAGFSYKADCEKFVKEIESLDSKLC
jgi:hypothetical protein